MAIEINQKGLQFLNKEGKLHSTEHAAHISWNDERHYYINGKKYSKLMFYLSKVFGIINR